MKTIFGFVLICTTFLSCSKEAVNEEEPSFTGEASVKSALVNTDWVQKHIALIYSPDLVDNSDLEACKLDDVYRYSLNGSADVVFGSVDCSAYPHTSGSYGTWELQANGTVLKQTVTRDVPGFTNGEVIYWTVDYITDKKMRIKRTVTEPGKTYIGMDSYIRK